MSQSLAVAGCGGFIGKRFVQAAMDLRIPTYGFDPMVKKGAMPIEIFESETEFFRDVPEGAIFLLALHPWARSQALELLLQRAQSKRTAILMEKPMTTPEDPMGCRRLIQEIEGSSATLLFDFPELYDPITWRIIDFLQQFQNVQFVKFYLERTKDREANTSRNMKISVPIQHQETVHCLAFVLFIVGHLFGSFDKFVEFGLSAYASVKPYLPPNPQDYGYVVDGRCDYLINFSGVDVQGITDFKAGAQWSKRKEVFVIADGREYHIESGYLTGNMFLRINGECQKMSENGSTHQAVICRYHKWLQEFSRDELHRGLFPHSHFAHLTYALSSMLWRSGYDGRAISVASLAELLAFDARFFEEVSNFNRY